MKKERDRLQLLVGRRTIDRLDKLADALGWSRNEVAEKLLELGTSGHQWVLNQLGSMVVGAAASALGKKQKGMALLDKGDDVAGQVGEVSRD